MQVRAHFLFPNSDLELEAFLLLVFTLPPSDEVGGDVDESRSGCSDEGFRAEV